MPSIRGFWQQWVFTDLPLYFNITKFHRSFNARRQTTLCMLCTAEVNMAFPKAHSVGNDLLHQNGHDSQKNRQKCKADPGKQEKKTLSAIGNTARIFPKCNEACKRSHQRPCTAHIDANQKSAGILREATEQNGGRDIADDLTGERGDQHRSVGQKAGEQHPDRFHPGKIAGKGEESGEGSQQSPIYGLQCVPIQKPERQNNDNLAKNISVAAGPHRLHNDVLLIRQTPSGNANWHIFCAAGNNKKIISKTVAFRAKLWYLCLLPRKELI